MMIKYGNSIMKYGSNVPAYSLGFDIEHVGNVFPWPTSTTNRYYFTFIFSSPSSLSIDYGNGDVVNYVSKINGNIHQVRIANSGEYPVLAGDYDKYVYPDGLNKYRLIRVSVPEPLKVTGIEMYRSTLTPQPLRIKFLTFPNLTDLLLNFNALTEIDDSFIYNNAIKTLSVRSTFTAGSRYFGAIPLNILLGKSYRQFSWSDTSFANKSFVTSNLDKIATMLSISALRTLNITSSNLVDNNAGEGGLPANFSMLNLITLDIQQNRYTTVPDVVDTMISLQVLLLSITPTLTNLGDFRHLVNLRSLYLSRCTNLEVALPSWFNSLVSLKVIEYVSLGENDANKQNAWILELYNFVTNNAAITGSSTLPFRSMSINISSGNEVVAPIPTGVYQQPSGYVQRVNNGTPVSSLERIWVLVNQYLHTIAYKAI